MGDVHLEKAIVVGVGLKSEILSEIKDNLIELEELVYAAGGTVVGSLTQVLPQWNPATLIGSGKVQEIKEMIQECGAQFVVIDHHLSGVQSRNLESEWKIKVLDRSQLILEIFAQRAQSFEGKMQVELAQLLDQMPRMIDAWHGSLSRLGGGIGTRGPGEKAIEIDRRRTRVRISQIRKKLKSISKNRAQHRWARKRNKTPSFALIGYTNSGKSTLLNTLTQSEVFTEDQLFATLDPTTRKIFLRDDLPAVITDTVGFIYKLPHQLIEAFKATLEESEEADVLLHVIDLAHPKMNKHIEVVEGLIKELGWDQKPILHVFNKIDIAPPQAKFQIKHHPRVFISAKTGEGTEQLKNELIQILSQFEEEYELFIPTDEEKVIYELTRDGQIIKKEQATQGTILILKTGLAKIQKWKSYLAR